MQRISNHKTSIKDKKNRIIQLGRQTSQKKNNSFNSTPLKTY